MHFLLLLLLNFNWINHNRFYNLCVSSSSSFYIMINAFINNNNNNKIEIKIENYLNKQYIEYWSIRYTHLHRENSSMIINSKLFFSNSKISSPQWHSFVDEFYFTSIKSLISIVKRFPKKKSIYFPINCLIIIVWS